MNNADLIALINAINGVSADKNVSLEMQPDPEIPIDVAVETSYGLVTLRYSILDYSRCQFTIFSDDPEVAQALESEYAILRHQPGQRHKKAEPSQLLHEESTDGVFALFHGLLDGANYYVMVKLPK